VDVSVCRDSDFNILREPVFPGGNYSVAFTVDDDGKATLVAFARQVGSRQGTATSCPCGSCGESGTLASGFRAEVRGTDQGNGMLFVTSARASNDLDPNDICGPASGSGPGTTPEPASGTTNEPASASTPAPTPKPSRILCFSGHSTVNVKDKGMTQMRSLSIGDEVLVQDGRYSKVYSFGHRHYDTSDSSAIDYVQIQTAGANAEPEPLEISEDHLLYVVHEGLGTTKLVRAGHIKVGDALFAVGNGATDDDVAAVRVASIRRIKRRGAFAPFTVSGDIVVNGVVASNYIALPLSDDELLLSASLDQQHSLQHLAHTPYRAFCTWVSSCEKETYNAKGFSKAVAVWLWILEWLNSQSRLVQSILLFLVFTVEKLLFLTRRRLVHTILAATVAYCFWKRTTKRTTCIFYRYAVKLEIEKAVAPHQATK